MSLYVGVWCHESIDFNSLTHIYYEILEEGENKTPDFTFLGVKLGVDFAKHWSSMFIAEREGFEPITLTAYMSATLLSKFQIGNETVTIFNR